MFYRHTQCQNVIVLTGLRLFNSVTVPSNITSFQYEIRFNWKRMELPKAVLIKNTKKELKWRHGPRYDLQELALHCLINHMYNYRRARVNLKWKLPLFYAILIALDQKQEKKDVWWNRRSVIQMNEILTSRWSNMKLMVVKVLKYIYIWIYKNTFHLNDKWILLAGVLQFFMFG